MKALSIISVSLWLFCFEAKAQITQQLETFNSGTYGDIFQTNSPSPTPEFTLVNGVGLNSTRGIQPLNIRTNLNYLRRGSFDMSAPNSTLEISAFFQIQQPNVAYLGVDTLQLGFVQNQKATSFIAAEQASTISWWIYANSTVPTNGGFTFQTTIDSDIYNGSTSAGFGYGTPATPLLKTNNWYKADFQVTTTTTNSSVLTLLGTIDDYGTSGQSYVGRVDTIWFQNVSTSASYPFSILTTDKTLYPAIHGMVDGGLKVVDNVSCAGSFSPATASSVTLLVQISFVSQSGKSYDIDASYDMNQWTTIESAITGTGSTINRNYPATTSQRYFRITPE